MTGARRIRSLLLHRIHRHYQTQSDTLEIGRLSFPFLKIEDPNVVLDQVAEMEDLRHRLYGSAAPGDELRMPYWAHLWDSAIGLGHHLEQHWRCDGPSLDVLDLGCGMGMAGTVAAALGHHVLFADLEPPALLLAQYNGLAVSSSVRARRLNWRTTRLCESFDLILGADILYERSEWQPLEAFWQHHLREGGTILLGEPGRQTGRMFIDWLRDHPWTLTRHAVTTSQCTVGIFELRRR